MHFNNPALALLFAADCCGAAATLHSRETVDEWAESFFDAEACYLANLCGSCCCVPCLPCRSLWRCRHPPLLRRSASGQSHHDNAEAFYLANLCAA
jgi:hypothetical protein